MSRKKTTKEFINHSLSIWGDETWDYSKTKYIKREAKLVLICKKHNHEFKQTADAHLKRKNGCLKCRKNYSNSDIFIEKSKKIWGDNKYDYSKINYTNSTKSVTLICTEHNYEFIQTANNHLRKKNGCVKCRTNYMDNDEFIEKSKKICGDNKYDYSKTKYINNNTPIILICKKHNHEFKTNTETHTRKNEYKKRTGNCKFCISKTTDEFIKESKKIWGDIYDYTNLNYVNSHTNIKIKCKKHNYKFNQRPDMNLKGQIGCKYCLNGTTEDFIEKANIIHNKKYDYSKADYIKSNIKIEIYCNKHREYFSQTPNNHLAGNGCPICNESKGELMIKEILEKMNLKYNREYIFKDCIDKTYLRFDFYLPEYNTCIEFDGIQHFKPIKNWRGEKGLKDIKKRDEIKNKYCDDNNIKLLRIKYNEKNNLIENKIMKLL